MKSISYVVLLVDRKKAKLFILREGSVQDQEEFTSTAIPQKVKHGDDTWDAQDKIFRHIQDHLSRNLIHVAIKTKEFAQKNHSTSLIIGGNKQFFPLIKKHLSYPLTTYLKGTFVAELNAPFNEVLERAKKCITAIEAL